MEISENKYKSLTNQIYKQIINENGPLFLFTPQNILNELTDDDLLLLLTSKLTSYQRVGLSFMVFLFSNNISFSDLYKRVSDNLLVLDVKHYFNLDYKFEDCAICDGSGTESCYECDGNGQIDCSDCGGTGEKPCKECDESGEDENGNACMMCDGNGELYCVACNGDGYEECTNCNGNGEYDCVECDGNGDIETAMQKWETEVGNIFTINPRTKYFKENNILDEDEAKILIKLLKITDFVKDEYEEIDNQDFTSQEVLGKKEVWYIENISEILI